MLTKQEKNNILYQIEVAIERTANESIELSTRELQIISNSLTERAESYSECSSSRIGINNLINKIKSHITKGIK